MKLVCKGDSCRTLSVSPRPMMISVFLAFSNSTPKLKHFKQFKWIQSNPILQIKSVFAQEQAPSQFPNQKLVSMLALSIGRVLQAGGSHLSAAVFSLEIIRRLAWNVVKLYSASEQPLSLRIFYSKFSSWNISVNFVEKNPAFEIFFTCHFNQASTTQF